MELIRLDSICKSFGKVRANHQVSLTIHQGKVLALLGENGAGKSTLMSILAGQLQPDSGTILHQGREVAFSSTEKAIDAGIGMVYQHFMLVDALTVAENVLLGSRESLLLNSRKMESVVAELAQHYSMDVKPGTKIRDLSMGERQQVEILKLLYRQSSVLIFDEPTAVLTPKEIRALFATMKQMVNMGKGIVFISHKLEEVMEVSDSIAILRRGEIVDQVETAAVSSTAELAERMVGREVLLEVDKSYQEPRQIILKVNELNGDGLEDISFELRQGELLAIVGVAGNGQKPLVENICGLKKPSAGTIRILGTDWAAFFKKKDWENSLSYIPEDRQGLATCQGLDLLENFLLTTRGGFARGPWLPRQQAKERAEKLLVDFDIRPPDLKALAWQLSGGNLQKMVLAREFYRRPRLIVAEQPTQGLDIAAAEDVWNLLLKAREAAGILLVTGDLNEALALADRVAVMFDGRFVDLFSIDDQERVDDIPRMMAGLGR